MSHAEEVGRTLDVLAAFVFTKAIADNRAGEVLYRLFDGEGVTVDPETKELIFLPAALFEQLAEGAG